MKKGLFIVLAALTMQSPLWSQCGIGQVSLTMVIHTDAWPYETYWQLVPEGVGCGNQVIAEGSNLNVGCASIASDNSPEGYAGNAMVNVGPICLDSGSYDLIFIDTYGDGGLSFELYENGVLMHAYTGQGFGSTFTFSTGVTLIPSFDSPCQALPIVPDGPSVSVNNINATASLGEPIPNGNDCSAFGSWCETGVSNSVWLTFEPSPNVSYEITTCHPETNTDTQMALWKTQNCLDFSTYQLVSSNDDMMGGCNSGGNVYASQLYTGCLDTSYQYFLQIDGWNGATGDIEVSVSSSAITPVLSALVHNVTCPLNKGELGDGFIQPYIVGSGIDFSCQWSGPNGFSANTWIIDQLESGDYFLTATTSCGASLSQLFTVTQPEWWNVLPNATPPSCADQPDGGFAPLVTGGTPDYGFQWLGPNGFTSIAPTLSNLSAGSYDLTVTDANGCSYNAQYTLQGNDALVFDLGSPLSLCLNDQVVISGPQGSNLIYYWQDGSSLPDYSIVAQDWGLGEHFLTLIAVSTSGCFGTDTLNFIVNDCVGILESGVDVFEVYPNPSNNGELNVKGMDLSYIKLFDLTGRLLNTIAVANDVQSMNAVHLQSGCYCVKGYNRNNQLIGEKKWVYYR